MTKDYVCGMGVNEQQATKRGLTGKYHGHTDYCSSLGCQRQFDQHPEYNLHQQTGQP